MAGEDYVSPINGKTYRVPKYEEPADAPVAFKDFADNLPPGGIDFEPDRIGQVVQSLDGAEWDKGMSLNVVDAVPADDDAGYEIGDVVFVTGPGDGGSSGVGGKVLQVVSQTQNEVWTTTSTSYQPVTGLAATLTPASASSKIMIFVKTSQDGDGDGSRVETALSRNGTQIGQADGKDYFSSGIHSRSGTDGNKYRLPGQTNIDFLDAPNTTSALTYQVSMRVSSGTAYLNRANDSEIYRGVSSITLMEVSA